MWNADRGRRVLWVQYLRDFLQKISDYDPEDRREQLTFMYVTISEIGYPSALLGMGKIVMLDLPS